MSSQYCKQYSFSSKSETAKSVVDKCLYKITFSSLEGWHLNVCAETLRWTFANIRQFACRNKCTHYTIVKNTLKCKQLSPNDKVCSKTFINTIHTMMIAGGLRSSLQVNTVCWCLLVWVLFPQGFIPAEDLFCGDPWN